jgi:hypothetical protein
MIVEVPIVKSIEQCTTATLPADWAAKRDRWIKFHVFRTVASVISFVCLAIALLQK